MKIYDLGKTSSGNKLYRHIVQGPFDHEEQFLMKNGFYIVLVTNGTATLSASDHTHDIGSRDLVIMTPSMECSVVPVGTRFLDDMHIHAAPTISTHCRPDNPYTASCQDSRQGTE